MGGIVTKKYAIAVALALMVVLQIASMVSVNVQAGPLDPAVSITSPTTSPSYSTTTSTINLAGTASDDTAVASVTWSNLATAGSGTATGTTSWSITGISLSSGSNVITVTAHDGSGNIGTDAITVDYDTSGPLVTITSPTSSPNYYVNSATTSVNLGGTAIDPSGISNVSWSNSLTSASGYVNPGYGFNTQVVDGADITGRYSSVATDMYGTIHAAYYDQTAGDLKHVWKPSGDVWYYETVDSAGDVGQWTSIACGSDGTVHIAYYDVTNLNLKHAWGTAGSWQTETVDMEGTTGQYTDIVVASDLTVYINFKDGHSDLACARQALGDMWRIEKVDSVVANTGQYTSMAIDSTGEVHIAYQDVTNLDLWHAWRSTSGTWSTECVNSYGNIGYWISLAIGPDDTLHLSYQDSPAYDLWYSYKPVGGSWSSYQIDTTNAVGFQTSIAVGLDGVVHISYVDNTLQRLRHAFGDGVNPWTFETADAVTVAQPDEASILVDAGNTVHIIYQEFTNKFAKHAWKTGDVWSSETIEGKSLVGTYAAAVVGSDGTIHVSYYDSTNKDLKYAFKPSGGSWNVQTIDSSGDTGQHTAIAVDGSGTVHISYQYVTNGDLRHAWKPSGGTWSYETIDTINSVGAFTSILAEPDGTLHISHYDATTSDLKHVWKTPTGSWNKESVDTTGLVGLYTSITRDSTGTLHICYYDATNKDVKHAWKPSGGSWSYETVDSTNDVGLYLSSAMDQSDKLHILYRDSTTFTLKHASKASGGSWSFEAVPGIAAISSVCTSVDASGTIHATLIDSVTPYFKHAWKTSGSSTWVVQTLYDMSATTGTTSFIPTIVDANGRCHMIYYDSNNRLSYAYGDKDSWTVRSVALNAGNNVITVTVKDSLGNSGSDSITIVRDTANPTLTVTSPSTPYKTTSSTVTFTGTASDANGVARVTWSNNRGGFGVATGTASWTIANVPMSFGANYINITAEDLAGNKFQVTRQVYYSEHPGAPQNLVAACSERFVMLTWTPASNGGMSLLYYDIYRGDSSGTETLLATIDSDFRYYNHPEVPPCIGYMDEAIVPGHTYYYYVVARNYVTSGPHSAEVIASPDYQFDTYDTTTMVAGYATGLYSDMAIDSHGHVYFVYQSTADALGYYHLILVTNETGTWQSQTLDPSAQQTVGEFCSIAIDSLDNIHIAYIERTVGWFNVKYIHGPYGSLSTPEIIHQPVAGAYGLDIAVDNLNQPCISYYYPADFYPVVCAIKEGSVWNFHSFNVRGTDFTSICTDSLGNIYIAFRSADYNLYCVERKGGVWSQPALVDGDTGSLFGQGVGGFSLKADDEGRLHIAYNQWHGIMYKMRDVNGVWGPAVCVSQSAFGNMVRGDAYPTLQIDSNGKVHIAYATGFGGDGGSTDYATNVDGHWVIQTITIGITGSGVYGKLALDPSDNIVSVMADGNGYFRLVKKTVPVMSTLLNVNSYSRPYVMCEDPTGNIIIGGYTNAFDFPQKGSLSFSTDGSAFLCKFTADLSTLIWSVTFNADKVSGLATDQYGNIYATGITSSYSFPTTTGAYSTINPGGTYAYVMKISPSGQLLYSSYFGGGYEFMGRWDYNGYDCPGSALAVDASGDMYIVGYTGSSAFPVKNYVRGTFQGGSYDGFVARISPDGLGTNDLVFSTYLGGTLDDFALCVTLDPSGNVCVGGATGSSNFPKLGAFRTAVVGATDGFVTKLSSTGTLLYSTLLGGSYEDWVYAITTDSGGDIYITGRTQSSNFHKVVTGYTPVFVNNLDNLFVTRISPDGAGIADIVMSTGLRSCTSTIGMAISLDHSGNIIVTGRTSCTSLPVTLDAYMHNFAPSTTQAAFILRFGSTGNSILYCSYLSAIGSVDTYNMLLSQSADVVLVGDMGGAVAPNRFPTYSRSYTRLVNSTYGQAIYVFRLDIGLLPTAPRSLAAVPGFESVELSWAGPLSIGDSSIIAYNIYRGTTLDNMQLINTVGAIYTYLDENLSPGIYYYKVSAVNLAGEGTTSSVVSGESIAKVLVADFSFIDWSGNEVYGIAPFAAPFVDHSVTNAPGGITSWLWDFGDGSTSTQQNPTHVYALAGIYDVTLTVSNSFGSQTKVRGAYILVQSDPSAPRNLIAIGGLNQVSLSWDVPLSDGESPIIGYRLYRSSTADGTYQLIGVCYSLSTIDDLLVGGTTWFYKVSAFNGISEGPASSYASATVLALVPSEPTDLIAVAGTTGIVVFWNSPASDGGAPITLYNVYRSAQSTGPFNLIGSVATTFYDDAGLIDGTTYYYRVSALNFAGEGEASDYASSTFISNLITILDPTSDPSYFSPSSLMDISGSCTQNSLISYVTWVNSRGGSGAASLVYSYPIETVSSNNNVGEFSSIATDASGCLHISYYDRTNGNLMHASRPVGGTWLVECVDAQGDVGQFSSITIDSAGVVHIIYYDATNGRLKHSYKLPTDSTWTRTGTIVDYDGGQFTSLAIDVQGTMHVSYNRGAALIHAVSLDPLGMSWAVEQVDGYIATDSSTSIGIDPFGGIHICYIDAANANLKHAYKEAGGSWTIEIADSVWGYGEYSSLAIDSMGGVHIAYYLDGGQSINHAYKPRGGTWSYEPVDNVPYPDGGISIGIDPSDGLHITYCDNKDFNLVRDLKHAYKPLGGTWSTEVLDGLGNAGWYSSIAFDLAGRFHISYYDLASQDLKHVSKVVSGWGVNGVMLHLGVNEISVIAHDVFGNADSDSIVVTYYHVPSEPLYLTAVGGKNSITLSWTAPLDDGGSEITSYQIYRSIDGDSYTLLASTNTLAYVDSGLADGATWFYKISALNSAGESVKSTEASATTYDIPSAPTNLVAEGGLNQIILSWTAPTVDGGSAIASFNVYRSSTATGTYSLIGSSTSNTYIDPSLASDTTWFYKVAARNTVGEGPMCAYSSATTFTYAAMGELTVAPEENQATISWSLLSDGGASVTGYKIYVAEASSPDSFGSFVLRATVPANQLTYVDSTWSSNPGLPHQYKVTAINVVGESPASNIVAATKSGAPSQPYLSCLGQSTESIDLNYKFLTGPVLEVRIQVMEPDGYVNVYYGSIYGSGFGPYEYHFLVPTNGKSGYFTIAIMGSNIKGISETNTLVVPHFHPPVAPTSLSASCSPNTNYPNGVDLVISWQPAIGYPVTGYSIYRLMSSTSLINPSFPGQSSAIGAVSGVGSSAYRDTTANVGTYCYYWVACYNDYGIGPLAGPVSVHPLTYPSAPRSLSATSNVPGQITLSWSAPSSFGGDTSVSYSIYRDGVLIGEVSALTYIDSNLAIQQYTYQVKARNGAGLGLAATVQATPMAPTTVAEFSASTTQGNAPLTVSFTDLSTTNAPGGITSWSWDFGDGTTSNEVNPTHVYLKAGTFSVVLVVANEYGSSSCTHSNLITVQAVRPGAPLNVNASVDENGIVSVTWDAPTFDGGATIDYYKIVCSGSIYPAIGFDWQVNGGTLSCIIPSWWFTPEIGRTYDVQVVAHNSVGIGTGSVADQIRYCTVPNAPYQVIVWRQPLLAGGNCEIEVRAEWRGQDIGGLPIHRCLIYRACEEEGMTWIPLHWEVDAWGGQYEFDPNREIQWFHYYLIDWVTPGYHYHYKVCLENELGTGPFSSEISTRAYDMPDAPQNLAASLSGSSIALAWSSPLWDGDRGIFNYTIYRGTSAGTETKLAVVSGSTLSYLDSTIQPGTTYYYVVVAANDLGYGEGSNEVSIALPVTIHADYSVSAASGTAPFSVSFTDLSTTNDPSDIVSWLWNFGDGGTSTEQSPTHVFSSAGVYTVSLTVTTALGSDSESKVNLIVVIDVPSAPNNLVAEGGVNEITLSWTAPTVDGGSAIALYRVYRSATVTGTYSLIGSTMVNSYIDTSLANGATWYYKVSAVNAAGGGPMSAYASAITFTTPAAPITLIATGGSNEIFLSWSASSNGGLAISGYNIYRSSSLDGSYSIIGTSGTTSYTDEGLGDGVIFFYKVAAVNAIGVGQASEYASAQTYYLIAGFSCSQTLGAAPTTISFTDLSDTNEPGGITSWTWNFGDGTLSTVQNPSHVYSGFGRYSVGLSVITSVDSASVVSYDLILILAQTDASPFVYISSPVVASNGYVHTSTTNLGGVATDDYGISDVTWSSDGGFSGTADLIYSFAIETVDSPSVGFHTSVAVDQYGGLHVAYLTEELNIFKVMYAYRPVGGSWIIESVASAGNIESNPCIVLDRSLGVHICYCDPQEDGVNRNLKHAYKPVGGAWTTETVESGPYLGFDASMTIDSSGGLHISYHDYINGVLKHAFKLQNGAWVCEIADSSVGTGYHTSITMDSMDGIHISYYDEANYDLKHAYKPKGGSWTTETVDATGDVGLYTSIKLDSVGGVHISYYDQINGDLKHAYKLSNGAWAIETVDATGDVGQYTSLVVDASNEIHISYYDYSHGILKHVYKSDGEVWSVEILDNDQINRAGLYSSSAIDPSGNLHVFYFSHHVGSQADLRHVTPTIKSVTWTISGVPLNPGVNKVIVTVNDLAGNSEQDVINLIYDANSPALSITSPTVDSISYTSQFVIDLSGSLSDSYGISSLTWSNPQGGSGVGALVYSNELENIPGATNANSPSMVMDRFGGLHVSYCERTGLSGEICRLMYAYKPQGGSWTLQMIDSTPESGKMNFILTDSNGGPHIFYQNFVNSIHNLVHAYQNGDGSWAKENVGRSNHQVITFQACGAFGSDGTLHFCYFDYDNSRFVYGNKPNDGSWHYETMTGIGSMPNRIVVDSFNGLHYFYYDSVAKDLIHAYRLNGGSWTKETVDSVGDVGRNAIMTLDPNGGLHVIYYQSTTVGVSEELKLKHAYKPLEGSWVKEYASNDPITSVAFFKIVPSGVLQLAYKTNGIWMIGYKPVGGNWVIQQAASISLMDSGYTIMDDSGSFFKCSIDSSEQLGVRKIAPIGWTISGVALQQGSNEITVTTMDFAGNVQSDIINIIATQPPTQPTGLVATRGLNSISLAWSAPSSSGGIPITGYNIYSSSSAAGPFILLTTTTETYFVEDGLANGETRYYRVTAVNAIGEGAFAEVSEDALDTPSVSSLSAVATASDVTISWSLVDDGGLPVTRYNVYIMHTTWDGDQIQHGEYYLVAMLPPTQLSYVDSDWPESFVPHYYKVTAVNGVGESQSPYGFAFTMDEPPPYPTLEIVGYTNPQYPKDEWITVVLNIEGYSTQRWVNEINTWSVTMEYPDGSVHTRGFSHKDGGMLAYMPTFGLSGLFKLSGQASNSKGWGPVGTVLTVPHLHPDEVPSSVSASCTPNSAYANGVDLTISWVPAIMTDPGIPGFIPGIVGYRVYRTDGLSAPSESVTIYSAYNTWDVTTGSPFRDTTAIVGKYYYYWVAALNIYGAGTPMGRILVHPLLYPSAPTNLIAASNAGGQVSLSWSAPTSLGGDTSVSYSIYRDGALIGTTNGLTYVDSGLAVQQYTYEVKATNGAGQGPAVTVQYTPVAVSVIADFSISTTLGNAPLSVYFVDLSTTNDPSGIVSWLWNFGDGVTSVEQNPTHVYSMAGIYTVSLTITTSLGQDVESKVDLISVLAIAPDAPHSFTAIVSGRSISLSWTVPPSNGGAPITAYKLYRGATSGSLQLLATAGNVFVYDDANLQPGTYYYAVSAVNEAELEGPLSSEASAVVANTPPVASFTMTGSDNDFDTQTLVTFNASSSHDAETPYANLQYRWTWMNPSTPGYVFFTSGWTNNPVISLVFPLWGVTYQGTLEVKDGQGAVATTNCNIWLWDADYISAGFSVTPGSGPVATEFAFDASASKYGYSMGGTFPVDQVRWTGRMTACGTSIGPPPRPQYTPFHHLGRTRLS